MKEIVFDIEGDALLKKITKIYCLCYQVVGTNEKGSLRIKEEIIKFFQQDAVFIGHYVIPFDFPALLKVYGIARPKHYIDTCGISWYLYCQEPKHGLETWGEKVGIHKPTISSWTELTVEEYIYRCEQDVYINVTIYLQFKKYLHELYEGKYQHLINYLNFKLDNLREREEVGIDLDINLCLDTIGKITPLIEDKLSKLSEAMPKKILKKAPKVMHKANGDLSVSGANWLKELLAKGLPGDSKAIYINGNPGSHTQIKEWLFSLGWEPITFETSKSTGLEVPKVSIPQQGLCQSVKNMFEDYPVLKELDNLYMLKHRLGVLEGFIECVDEDWKITSSMSGFTNTLRVCHVKPICNLVGVDKPWGKEIRDCLKVSNDKFTMLGADICALEDSSKQHYMFYYDPDYVNNMRVPGFDPHIDIAVFANLMTKEEGELFKTLDKSTNLSSEEILLYASLKKKRSQAKVLNFSGIYGVGPPKIAKTLKISLQEAKILHAAYWERNKAVKLIAASFQKKTVQRQLWAYNPVSKFWLSLRNDKDIFSTINQSTGSYIFDILQFEVKKRGFKIALEYHDEFMLTFSLPETKETLSKALDEAVIALNDKLKLNVPISISKEFGKSYGSVH